MTGRHAHRIGTAVLSLAMVAIGIALAVQALAANGIASLRLLLGALFLVAGCGRFYIELRRSRRA